MAIIERLAKRHIQRAMENGEFDNLEGAGGPLNFDPDHNSPLISIIFSESHPNNTYFHNVFYTYFFDINIKYN